MNPRNSTAVSDDVLNPRIAERLTRAARAAQTLSETLWEALHEELIDPRSQRVAELSGRLADVAATVASLLGVDSAQSSPTDAPPSIEGVGVPDRPATRQPPVMPAQQPSVVSTEPESHVARGSYDEPSPLREPSAEESRSPPTRESPATAEEPPSVGVLVDELAPEEPPDIEIRDERRERDPTAWIASIGSRLERYERDGLPFAVLLVELADVGRLRHAELPGEVARLTGLVEAALAGELAPADSLTRESPGRYWLLAPESDASSARALAGRLAEAVRGAASHRGAPLAVAVGIAVCPVDGSQAAVLAAHADLALYAARAAGRPVAP